jgi:ATP-binding cassette subfamily C protein
MSKDDKFQSLPDESLKSITGVLKSGSESDFDLFSEKTESNLISVLNIICKKSGLPFNSKDYSAKNNLSLNEIVEIAGFRTRQVALKGEWWKDDTGALLGFRGEDKMPCALIPQRNGTYKIYDAKHKHGKTLSPSAAKKLTSTAFCFYRRFPDKELKRRDIFKFAIARNKADFWQALSLQAGFSLLGLLMPIAMGFIFDNVIPEAAKGLLAQFVIILLTIVFAAAAFQVGQAAAFLRIRFQINVSMQAAIWDRLLRLPVNFFHKYTVGDLVNRASGIDQIQQKLTGSVMQSLIAGPMSIFIIILLFYYNTKLAFLVVALALTLAVLTIIVNLIQVRYQRKILKLTGQISGMVLQYLSSIAKLRVANAEKQAFNKWAEKYSRTTRLIYRANRLLVGFSTFKAFYSVITTMCIFALVVAIGDKLSFGDFIAFNAASAQFFMIIFTLVSVINNLIAIIPLYERAKPILKTLPESKKQAKRLAKLSGQVDIKEINFCYDKERNFIFNEFSLNIEPGEFLAIVGPSGAGKSTLFRLLLGFEKPETGEIRFDAHELSTLDVQQLRSRFGVVLQNARIIPGTIFENIAGTRMLSEEQAWQAARAVSLDKDIEAMPMGMHSLVMEGGKTLSAGQGQRLLIARAIAHQPDILLLDEATSALDNITQSTVHHNLDKLNITRIVAAHRLSTIQHADRIIVLDQGKLVQEGNFASLSATSGLFQELIERQQA